MTVPKSEPSRILLLGGTTEAALLAGRLAGTGGIEATVSLAGRTSDPAQSPLPIRIGGFGGSTGLADYLSKEGIDLVVDATHPFAARISNNAIAACDTAGIPLLAIVRPQWTRAAGDDWNEYGAIEAAITALPRAPQRVFSALGRQWISALAVAPQHHYVIRVIDTIVVPPEVPNATVVEARGPFRTDDDVALFRTHGIQIVLAKNSGGSAAYAKIEAAHLLGLKVHMIRRPPIAERAFVTTADAAMDWIGAHYSPRANRGV